MAGMARPTFQGSGALVHENIFMNTNSCEHFIAAVYEQIASWDLREFSSRWLIGVSGGCDSMALMYALARLGEI